MSYRIKDYKHSNQILLFETPNAYSLISYNTEVLRVVDGQIVIDGTSKYSVTTSKHITQAKNYLYEIGVLKLENIREAIRILKKMPLEKLTRENEYFTKDGKMCFVGYLAYKKFGTTSFSDRWSSEEKQKVSDYFGVDIFNRLVHLHMFTKKSVPKKEMKQRAIEYLERKLEFGE